jgi:hypothetical protein
MRQTTFTRTALGIMLLLTLSSSALASVGIRWDTDSLAVLEGDSKCITYQVYNPGPDAAYASIDFSGELTDAIVMQPGDAKLIPAFTQSSDALPMEFCFKVSPVFDEDCLIADFLCKQACSDKEMQFKGEVIFKAAASPGEDALMSVSAPLRLQVACKEHARQLLLLYIVIGIILLIVIAVIFAGNRPAVHISRRKKQKK